MKNTKSSTLSPVPYIRPVHPGIKLITNNATHATLYETKGVYNNNLWVFHEVRGFEQSSIQEVITEVDKQYIISMNNCTTGKFTGNIHQIFSYLLATYGTISPSHLNDFEKEVIEMHYEPVTPVENFQQDWRPSQVQGHGRMSLFTPSGNLQGI